jgi:filamentous hemagglutinin
MMTDSAVVKGKVSVTVGSSSQDNSYHVTNTHGTTVNAGESVVINARNDIVGQGVQIGGKKVLDADGISCLLRHRTRRIARAKTVAASSAQA